MNKIVVASIAFMLLGGCWGKTSEETVDTTQQVEGEMAELPKWVLEPDVADGVAGVGMAQPSKGGLQFQIPKAETDARANIATKIQSNISRITKQALREANVNGINDVEDVFSQATKEVVKDIPLSNVKRINMYQSKDGTLYVHMKMTKDDYRDYLVDSENVFKSRLNEAGLARENLNKSQEAVKSLFDELENI